MSKVFVSLETSQLANVTGGAIMGSRQLLDQRATPQPQPQRQPQPAQPGIWQLLRSATSNLAG